MDEPACQPVTSVIEKDPCVFAGLSLVVSGYRVPTQSQFQWHVFTQKDTLSNEVTPNKAWSGAGQERILVPDSVLKGVPKIVVQVSTLCNGKFAESINFPLVRKKGVKGACDTWTIQKP